jgi:hypothetical protein
VSDSLKQFADALGDRYELKRELGRGGMAVVYLAEDLKHRRQVAIKVFQPELAGSVGHERFLREIQVAANLTHPHILPLHDSGEAQGLLYYVMPFIQGETLRDRLRRSGQLTLHEAVRIASEIADALGYAHRQGLVHRDIKPENVMLTSGHALVMDFGICRAVGQASTETGITRAGLTVGTPAYMSPEQWTAPERVAEPSDIYSLGCVLYEMLVGEPPFTGTTTAVILARHTQQEMPSVRVVRPDVPESVEAVLKQGLAKIPEARFATAYEFAEALNAAITIPTITVPESLGQAPSIPRRSVARKAVPALGVVVLAGAAAAALWLKDGADEQAAGAATFDADRVVVDLLDNQTRDSTLNDIGRMAGDWITEGLHRTGAVDVVPSVTALQAAQFVRAEAAAGRIRDPIRALAEETGAGRIVTGAYYRDGDSIQFQVQITQVTSDGPRKLMNAIDPVMGSPRSPSVAIKELRTRVMGALTLALDQRVAANAEALNQPPNYEAYRAFSRGMDAYVRNANRRALPDFYAAYEQDPNFIVALLYAAFSHANLGEQAKVDSLTQMIGQRRAELSEYNRYWLEYLEARVRGNNARALTAIRQASYLAPESKATYNRAYIALITNQPKEAVDALELLDPDRGAMRGWFQYWQVLTDALHRLGEHKRELEAARRARVLYPERPEPRAYEITALAALRRTKDVDRLIEESASAPAGGLNAGEAMRIAATELRSHGHTDEANAMMSRALQWYRARPAAEASTPAHLSAYAGALQEAGHWQEAKRIVEGLARTEPSYQTWVGILAAGNGEREEAQRIDQYLAGLQRPYSFGFEAYQRARIAALLDERTRAVDLLRQAFGQGYPIPQHPDVNFERLRDYRPLQDLYTPRT